jgi:glycosyltransferase involved in cell wall biosynthesis
MPELARAFEASVIIPAFNAERYLAAAVESVLAQTVRPREIVVVDDGSADRTARIAEQFGAPVICLRRPHGGIAAARNFGVGAARGNWLAFLDADDLWTPEKLERQRAAAGKIRALEIIFGGIRQFVSPELSHVDQFRLAAPQAGSAAPHAGTMLARRAVFERVGPFDESLKLGEFIDWFARASDLGVRMTILPEIVLQRRRHPASTTLRQKDSLTEMAVVMKHVLDRRRQISTSLQR